MVRSRELCDKGRWAGGRFGLVGPDNAEVESGAEARVYVV